MDDIEARTLDELVAAALAGADGYGATVSHFGADSVKVAASAEFGIRYSTNYATNDAELAELRAWRDLGPSARRNAVLMDSTTVAAAVSLLTSSRPGTPNALTLWDLARFVEAVVAYDTIHHFANPSVDDPAVNARLGDQVLHPVSWPKAGRSIGGAAGLVYDAWFATHQTLKAFAAQAGQDTWVGRQVEELRLGWERTLGRPLTVADILDPREMGHSFTSPSQQLINELAELVGGQSPDNLANATFFAGLREPGRRQLTMALSECNYRAQVNQRLANFLGLAYAPSVARVPFRRLYGDLAREIDDRVRSIELADQTYAARLAGRPRPPRFRIALPVLLAVVLLRSAGRGGLWSSLAELRAEGAAYRARRAELEIALADENEDVTADAARAVNAEVDRLSKRLAAAGPEAENLAVAVAEAVPEFATNQIGNIGPALSALFAGARQLVPADLGRRLVWKWTRPHYRFLSDVGAESRALINAIPRIQRFWSVPDHQSELLADRFQAVADLTR